MLEIDQTNLNRYIHSHVEDHPHRAALQLYREVAVKLHCWSLTTALFNLPLQLFAQVLSCAWVGADAFFAPGNDRPQRVAIAWVGEADKFLIRFRGHEAFNGAGVRAYEKFRQHLRHLDVALTHPGSDTPQRAFILAATAIGAACREYEAEGNQLMSNKMRHLFYRAFVSV